MNTFGLNTQQSYLFFLLLLSLGLFSYSVQSMRFDLSHGKSARCFFEDIQKISTMVYGNYSIVNPNKGHPLHPNHTITVQVTHAEDGGKYHLAERVQAGQFAFTAYQTGDYLVCFMLTDDDPQLTFSVDFDWKTGVTAKGRPNIVKKSNIDYMTYEVQIMQETALAIKEEMSYLLQRNTEMLELNWMTDNRMLLFIFVSYFICFSVAGLQLWHLKTFFQKKKLI
ncbi:transmembrane emp24 domain-containing protein p24delta9-like [Trifolium pratense]|uniref:transmembrane emp24 domain-containing protein p24delta9-like n=1 Tax=Trifolium pratense TaxID=57577 RepID=UPI001E697493|nr:transmembrane emp24 domain-containing protein p24delta9-like [Trifolium pratense]